jgi:hypothetical protein
MLCGVCLAPETDISAILPLLDYGYDTETRELVRIHTPDSARHGSVTSSRQNNIPPSDTDDTGTTYLPFYLPFYLLNNLSTHTDGTLIHCLPSP